MTSLGAPRGLTLQIEVGDVEQARSFYSELFGSEPEFEIHDFLEWRVLEGTEVWLQAVGVDRPVRPLINRIRFGSEDVTATRLSLLARGIEVPPAQTLPGVVRFIDFEDPWGNRLGYYEDLAASGELPVVEGSVHDESLYVVDGE